MKKQTFALALLAPLIALPVSAQDAVEQAEDEHTVRTVDIAVPPPPPAPMVPPPVRITPVPDSPQSPQRLSRYPRNPMPAGLLREWVTPADYPPAAFVASQEGMVRYELDVSDEGRATACRLTEPSGHAALDDITCPLLLERARFAPAYDAERNAVAGRYSGSVNWQAREPAIRSINMAVEYTLDRQGRMQDCEILRSDFEGSELPPSLLRDACRAPVFHIAGVPYRNAAGEPVERRMRFTVVMGEVVAE